MSAYSFTKLFSSITESTIWCEPAGTRLVWITMLAKCDRHGRMPASLPGMARLANVTLAECEQAIQTLLSPDPYSRTPDNDGRRIEEIDGGWRLLNHAKYRDMRDDETRREQNREAKRRQREREQELADMGVSKPADSQPNVSTPPPESAHAYADADANTGKAKAGAAKRGTRLPADWAPSDEGKAYATDRRVNWKTEAECFRDYWTAESGARARKVDWDATWRTWVRRATPTLPAPGGPSTPSPRSNKPAETPLERDLAHARYLHSVDDGLDDAWLAAEQARITAKYREQRA